jgi:hypothetical protein
MDTFPQIFAISPERKIRKRIGGCTDLITILKREINNPQMPNNVKNQLQKNF